MAKKAKTVSKVAPREDVVLTKMNVIILPEGYAKVQAWVNHCVGEVSGLGKIVRVGSSMVVTEAYLLEQKCSAASTEIAPSAVTKLMGETMDVEGDLNWWWHSHANMGVFWSGTDHQQMKDTAGAGYVVATVFNKKGDHLSAYRQKSDGFLPDIFMDGLDTAVKYLPTVSQHAEWIAEATEKVKEHTYASSYTGGYGYQGRNFKKLSTSARTIPSTIDMSKGVTYADASESKVVPASMLWEVLMDYRDTCKENPPTIEALDAFYLKLKSTYEAEATKKEPVGWGSFGDDDDYNYGGVV